MKNPVKHGFFAVNHGVFLSYCVIAGAGTRTPDTRIMIPLL